MAQVIEWFYLTIRDKILHLWKKVPFISLPSVNLNFHSPVAQQCS